MWKLVVAIVIMINLTTNTLSVTESVTSIDIIKNTSIEIIKNFNRTDDYLAGKIVKSTSKHGISYNIPYKKFLIGNVNPVIAQKYNSTSTSEVKVVREPLNDGFEHSYLTYSNLKSYEFYTKGDTVLTRIDYHTQDWNVQYSRYLAYHFPDGVTISDEVLEILDNRIESFFYYFLHRNDELAELQKHKLDYFYCPDMSTIKLLTTYETRGISFLNQEYIVSTYPAHFHEITHFLINYLLKTNELFTHPFLQEGLAVGIGGRGGHLTSALMVAGAFLIDNDFVDYQDLFDANKFRQTHASMSYPVAGLLTRIMLEHYTFEQYLDLYQKYSNSSGNFHQITELKWLTKRVIKNYIADHPQRTVLFEIDEKESEAIFNNDKLTVRSFGDYYQFKCQENISFDLVNNNVIPSETGRFTITCMDDEIKIKDNLLDEIIAQWSKNFSLIAEDAPKSNGAFVFYVMKEVLD